MTVDGINLDKIKEQTATGLTELLDQAQLEKDDLVVLGLSTSEVHDGIIGEDSNIEIAWAIVSTVVNILRKHQLHLAAQGCEHLNRALVVERNVAKDAALNKLLSSLRSMQVVQDKLLLLKTLTIRLKLNTLLLKPAWTSVIPRLAFMLSLSKFQFALR